MKGAEPKAISLSEVNASIDTTATKGFWRKLLAFSGPAYLVSVGYMDPGNWATDIAGGSQFGYTLIWVLLMSNLIALLLQSLSARLGIVTGLDLAQASRATYPRFVNLCLYSFAEIAIAACDLAEVLGMAIGLQLLFKIPLFIGVIITIADTFLLLFLQNYGIRKLEAFILSLIGIIGLAFLAEMIFANPSLAEVATGFVPKIPNSAALYIAIGIIGATVMPHNLYLHSSLVQTRKITRSPKGIRTAIKFNILDSVIALNFAFFVNAAILILAAAAFYKNGLFNVLEIKDAYQFLTPLLGSRWASVLFAIALIAAGQSSTITGTLAGQVVMEGYLSLRIQPWLRRIITRLLAIIPALLVIYYFGESATGQMLILSQVILSMQLGFAIIPLIHFVSNKQKMGDFKIGLFTKCLAWLSAAVIVSLNIKLVADEVSELLATKGLINLFSMSIVLICLFILLLLLYTIFSPLIIRMVGERQKIPMHVAGPLQSFTPIHYQRIAIAIDFSDMDSTSIQHAIAQGGKNAHYLLIHVVETAGAVVMGNEIADRETGTDINSLQNYAGKLIENGYSIDTSLGYGNPKKAIPKIVQAYNADLLVMGAHGHAFWKDLILGTTVETVRHRIKIPVLIVRKQES